MTEEDVGRLFASFDETLRKAIVDHMIDHVMGIPAEKLAEYFVSCLAALSELRRS